MRHLSFISEFTGDLRHIYSADNVVADTLSCIYAIPRTPIALDLEAIAATQSEEPELEILSERYSSLVYTERPFPASTATILCNSPTGTPRPYVPSELRQFVFEALHNTSPSGIRGSQRLITNRFTWPSMNSGV